MNNIHALREFDMVDFHFSEPARPYLSQVHVFETRYNRLEAFLAAQNADIDDMQDAMYEWSSSDVLRRIRTATVGMKLAWNLANMATAVLMKANAPFYSSNKDMYKKKERMLIVLHASKSLIGDLKDLRRDLQLMLAETDYYE